MAAISRRYGRGVAAHSAEKRHDREIDELAERVSSSIIDARTLAFLATQSKRAISNAPLDTQDKAFARMALAFAYKYPWNEHVLTFFREIRDPEVRQETFCIIQLLKYPPIKEG